MNPLRFAVAVPVVALVAALAGCAADAASSAQPTPSATTTGHHHHVPVAGGKPGTNPTGQIVVMADEPMRKPLTTLARFFEEAYPDSPVALTFMPRTSHAAHIVAGSRADVFVSADVDATKQVAAGGTVWAQPAVVARDTLVIAVRDTSAARSLDDLAKLRLRVAMCVETARCGEVTRLVLTAAKLTIQPASLERDGRAAVGRVVSGAADAALVYRTDVPAADKNLRIIDSAHATRIADQYRCVAIRNGGNPMGAQAFLGFMTSALARGILAEAGFGPP